MIENTLALPFKTTVLGVPVSVERIHLTYGRRLSLSAAAGACARLVPLLDLPLPSPPPAGTEWIAAYRHWLGDG
jgi:hypothetical protein